MLFALCASHSAAPPARQAAVVQFLRLQPQPPPQPSRGFSLLTDPNRGSQGRWHCGTCGDRQRSMGQNDKFTQDIFKCQPNKELRSQSLLTSPEEARCEKNCNFITCQDTAYYLSFAHYYGKMQMQDNRTSASCIASWRLLFEDSGGPSLVTNFMTVVC